MHLEVALDHETSERAGAGGMFQIESVIDSETGDDLTNRVDVGVHFNGDADLDDYIKQIFGSETTFDIVGDD
ncbi:hypothetical protein [Novosphingobium sp.]|uniref:hypothetical protein n=1 Tax=Novosphingobium sp. TaxID=1874826 RepID=UPI003BA8CF6D